MLSPVLKREIVVWKISVVFFFFPLSTTNQNFEDPRELVKTNPQCYSLKENYISGMWWGSGIFSALKAGELKGKE